MSVTPRWRPDEGHPARQYLDLDDPQLRAELSGPELGRLRREGARTGRRTVLRYTWTAEEGFAPHARGVVQYSLRPYQVTDRCDGTRDGPALFVTRALLAAQGCTLEAAFAQAYPDEPPFTAPLIWSDPLWAAREAPLPNFTARTFAALRAGLHDMNHRSLAAVLGAWADAGHLRF